MPIILTNLMQILPIFCYPCDVTDGKVSLNEYFSDKSCSEFYINNGNFHLEKNDMTNIIYGKSSIKLIGKENTTIHCHHNAGLAF